MTEVFSESGTISEAAFDRLLEPRDTQGIVIRNTATLDLGMALAASDAFFGMPVGYQRGEPIRKKKKPRRDRRKNIKAARKQRHK